jgi:hypothetical protein
MREYGKISPQFWIGKTGKALRGHPEAQIVALYLMTCPNSEMTGVFYCPVLYIAQETGLGLEGASKGLARVCEVGFCTFEAETDTVFVHEMAKFQIGEELKPADNRVIGVQKTYASMPDGLIRRGFYEKYKGIFFLQKEAKKGSPSKAPSKPRAGAGEGTGDIPAKPGKKIKTPLPENFSISGRVEAWAKEKGYSRLAEHLENFVSAAKRRGYTYVDWDEALMEAIRKDWAKLGTSDAPVWDR